MYKKQVILFVLIILSSLLFAEQWEYWPQVKKSILDAGFIGGEGGQVVQAIACDQIDGTFLLAGADVGGLNRSIDGGVTWQPANVGFSCEGVAAFAIDPNNADRALVVGGNSGPPVFNPVIHGLYLTTDRGASWQLVLPAKIAGYRDMREQVAFDYSSYNATLGYSTVAYWSRADQKWAQWGEPEVHPALYKSIDGGLTWEELANSTMYGGGIVKIHPQNGYVYIGNRFGLFKSTTGGESFTQIFDQPVTGLDVVATALDNVYWITETGLYVSENSGNSFQKIETTKFPAPHASALKVSPVNHSRMILNNQRGQWWEQDKYFSHDGGITWKTAATNSKYAFLPFNGRQSMFAWHPKDENQVWGMGGDWITKSVNGGKTFEWAYNGISAVLQTGKFNFSVQNPNVLLITTQDYDCSLTIDGGITWKYLNMSGNGWGGFFYGGYALNERVMYAAERPGWDGDRKIVLSRDGGKSFLKTDVIVQGFEVGYSAPGDTNILFLGDHYSTDQGISWSVMENCEGVFISNPVGEHELYGICERRIVVSFDKGETWDDVTADFESDIYDVGINHIARTLYIAGGDQLYKYDFENDREEDITTLVPADQLGNRRFRTVAVDPVDPNIVYAGGNHDIYAADNSVVRSIDGGQSWHSISVSKRLNTLKYGMDGGKEALAMRVHPVTRYLHVGTMCHGQWKFSPPGSSNNVITSENQLPEDFELYQNYPNPFNPVTRIKYFLSASGQIDLAIYNLQGERVKTLDADFSAAGIYETVWDGNNSFGNKVSSGIYLCKLITNGVIRTKKMLLIR